MNKYPSGGFFVPGAYRYRLGLPDGFAAAPHFGCPRSRLSGVSAPSYAKKNKSRASGFCDKSKMIKGGFYSSFIPCLRKSVVVCVEFRGAIVMAVSFYDAKTAANNCGLTGKRSAPASTCRKNLSPEFPRGSARRKGVRSLSPGPRRVQG